MNRSINHYRILCVFIGFSLFVNASEADSAFWDPLPFNHYDEPTFGWIHTGYLPWIYCYEFPGWMYVRNPDKSKAHWFYRDELGWFWSHSEQGGWVYSSFYGMGRYDRYVDLVSAYEGEVVPLCSFGCTVPPSDPVSIQSMALADGILELSVQYSGGCETHDFYLFADYWLEESFPPIATVYLIHNGHEDSCDSIETNTLRFDLTAMLAIWGLEAEDPFILDVNEAQLVIGN